MKKIFFYLLGLLAGLANGLFGSGGGMVTVPLLEKADISPRKAHATSIAIILPLCTISTILYFKTGHVTLKESIIFIPGGIAGSIAGALILKKINSNILKKIFAIILIIAGIRILYK